MNAYVIDGQGNLEIIRLSSDVAHGERYQAVVPAGCWFASATATPKGYSLVGCPVAPGLEFVDFELAVADQLAATYPQHEALIRKFTR